MKDLIQELEDLAIKQSNATDLGKTDVADKGKDEVSFNLMRNSINTDGEIEGADVADYLERAAELNDQVDSVAFGLETDDGQFVKVYVNATQADEFAEALKQLLGVEDDLEEAINRLATDYDIVDVVWPDDGEPEEPGEDPEEGTPADDIFDDLTGDEETDDDDEEFELLASIDDEETDEFEDLTNK